MNKMYKESFGRLLDETDYFFGKRHRHRSLKGLYKPFKSKGEYYDLIGEINSSITELECASMRLINTAKETMPIKYLPIFLRGKKNKGGAFLIYWRRSKKLSNNEVNPDEIEGKQVIYECLHSDKLTDDEKRFIKEFELDRIAINTQLSLLVRMRWMLRDCIKKIEEIDSVYPDITK